MIQLFTGSFPSHKYASKTLAAVSPVLKHHLDIPVVVTPVFDPCPETRVVVSMGKVAKEYLSSINLVSKTNGITTLRNRIFTYQEAAVLLTYSGDIGNVNHAQYVDLLTDIGTAVRVWRTGKAAPVYGEHYKFLADFSTTIADIEKRFEATGEAVDVTFDMETVGLDPFALPTETHPGAYIVGISFTIEEGRSDIVYFHSPKEEQLCLRGWVGKQVEWLLNSPKVKLKGANLKFDLVYLKVRAAIDCQSFTLDTTMVGSLLDENRSNSLNVHTKIYAPELGGYDDEFNATVDKGMMHLVPKEKFRLYLGGDTDANYRVARQLRSELGQDEALTRFYINILHPAARAFEEIEHGGVCIDHESYQQLGFELEQAMDQNVEEAKKIIGGQIFAKHFNPKMRGGLNLTKKSLLVDFLFSPMGLNLKPLKTTEKTKQPSTSLDHIEMFADVPEAKEFVKIFTEYSSNSKTYNTYYTGFLVHKRSDGRFHPIYWLFAGDRDDEDEGGTVTGRLSAKNPAFQTIPKHTKWGKRLRQVFIAPPGFQVMERDYSQGELRVVACIANEETMIDSYRNGMDLHVKTAAPFAGHTYESLMALEKVDEHLFSETRQLGKAGNFGLIYGMGVDGFIRYAAGNYGVTLDTKTATEFRTNFFQTYPGLLVYHEVYQNFARQYGYVVSPIGRIRHLPLINSHDSNISSKAERQAINSPVQGTLSDMLIWVMAIERELGLTKIAPSFGSVHDAAYNYIPEGYKDVQRHLDIMENLPFEKVGWNPQLKFIADAKVGPNMGKLSKFVGN